MEREEIDFDFEDVPLMRPPGECGKEMKRFIKIIEEKYDVKFGGYRDFHKWSIENLSEFWDEIWDFSGIICSRKYDKVIDLSVPMDEPPEWFPGALLNYAENLLKYRDDRISLISLGEDSEPRTYTFKEKYEHVKLYAAAFRKLGLKKGDRLACVVHNREEPVFAMLGAISTGAIFAGSMPLLEAQLILNRLQQISPKFLLTIDRFMHDMDEIDMLQKVKEIVEGLPTLEKVIIIPSKSESKLKDISEIKNSCFLDEFLEEGLDKNGTVPPLVFEQVSFSHPVLINFIPGERRGQPRATLQGCGTLLPGVKEFILHLDTDRESIWLCQSPIGLMVWNLIHSLSFSGIRVVQFEGVPYYLSPTYFWDMVEEYKVTHFFTLSSVANNLDELGYVPTSTHFITYSGEAITKAMSVHFHSENYQSYKLV